MNQARLKENLSYRIVTTWLGNVLVVCSEKGLLTIKLPGWDKSPADIIQKNYPESFIVDKNFIIAEVVMQLTAYFTESLKVFSLPLDLRVTEFQHKVLNEVITIPFGEMASYGDIAKRIGDPGASRAVGMANNKNPIPIIIPCHRIVGAKGKLVGYAGGVEMKHQLLLYEERVAGLSLF